MPYRFLYFRFLRQHAKKAMKEEKAFLLALRAEAKAKEDR